MTDNITLHPLNEISEEFLQAFASKVIAKIAVGIKELEGKVFEQFLCEIFGVEWKGSNNGLTDALIGTVGYSVKSKLHGVKGNLARDTKGRIRRVSTVVGRNSPDTFDGSHVEKNVTPADEAAKVVVDIWNKRLEEARELSSEFRQLTILKSPDLRRWLLFEFTPSFFDASQFDWKWEEGKGRGKKKKTINLYGINDQFKLTWQPNGSQFTLNQEIPEKYKTIVLKDEIPLISENQILQQIGFQNDWIEPANHKTSNSSHPQAVLAS